MKLKPCFLLITVACLLFTVCGYAQTGFSPQQYKTDVDKRINANANKLRYFVKLKGTEKPFTVPKPNYWPRDVEFNYSLFYDAKGILIYALKEFVPKEGEESGWQLMYAYYFLPDGKAVAVHKYATYFNRLCVGNETITEIDISYYDKDFKMKDRKYSLESESGKQLDSLQCEPPYHVLYKYAPTREEFLKENKFLD